MTETTASETAQAAAPAPAPAVESGLASRVAALEADVGSFKGRVMLLEGKLETWFTKHVGVVSAVGGFLVGVAFTILALKHRL